MRWEKTGSTVAVLTMLATSLGWTTLVRADDTLPPQIDHEPCEQYQKGKRFEILARFYDDSPIFDPKVMWRPQGKPDWKNAPFARVAGDEHFRAVIKAKRRTGPIEYFIEAFDVNGNGPARYGGPEAPILLKPARRPVACQQIQNSPLDVVDPSRDFPPGPVDPSAPVEESSSASNDDPVESASPEDDSASEPHPGGESVTAIAASPAQRTPATAIEAPPSAAKVGCDADDPPIYCSAWMWLGVVAGVGALGGGGVAIWYLTQGDETPEAPRQHVRIRVVGAPPPAGVP